VQALGDPGIGEDLDGTVLEHARADARLHVLARAVLDDDRLDALLRQQVGEQEPGRSGADDADLCAHATPFRRTEVCPREAFRAP
jgi:hypothetical protein